MTNISDATDALDITPQTQTLADQETPAAYTPTLADGTTVQLGEDSDDYTTK